MKIALKNFKKLNQKTKKIEPVSIYLDGYLKSALDTLVYNIRKDWDFLIVITGDRSVRTGKSVFGFGAIGSYLADQLNTPFDLGNIFFNSQSMIESASEMPKHSVLIYDEARESLASSKAMKQVQQDLLDYFAECGQLNHIFIIICPDFFTLKEDIAVARSELLLNVYRKETKITLGKDKNPALRFDRGYFEFYNRYTKQKLFDMARSTHKRNYNLTKPDFIGRFTNNYGVIDEQEYRKKKAEALSRFKERKKAEQEVRYVKAFELRDNIISVWHAKGLNGREISDKFKLDFDYDISDTSVNRIIHRKQVSNDIGA